MLVSILILKYWTIGFSKYKFQLQTMGQIIEGAIQQIKYQTPALENCVQQSTKVKKKQQEVTNSMIMKTCNAKACRFPYFSLTVLMTWAQLATAVGSSGSIVIFSFLRTPSAVSNFFFTSKKMPFNRSVQHGNNEIRTITQ